MKPLFICSVALAFLATSPSFAQRTAGPRHGARAHPATPIAPATPTESAAPAASAAPAVQATPQASENGARVTTPETKTPSLTIGGTVPYSYMVGGKYIEYKWQDDGLSSPPPGYAWMRIGEDFVLADQKSGAIKEVLKVSEQGLTLTEGGKVPYNYMVGGKFIDYKWQESGLSAPPQGYAWMRIGNKLVLADQRSGLIKEVRVVGDGRPGSAKIGNRRP